MTNNQYFSQELVAWFTQNKRDLPFRKTKEPYHIWLSEIMAQQTQIDTLIPYYERFIHLFPTVQDLADANEDEVLKAWEGLGYYSRARNLHKAAQIICSDYDGHFPNTYKDILALPGIGPYTGGAIASIALNIRVPAVDGNVLRVITRFMGWDDDIAKGATKKKVTQWVTDALPEIPGPFNEGIMELGALICTPKSPTCLLCPVREHCIAFKTGQTDRLPIKTKKAKQTIQHMEVALYREHGRLLLIKRPSTGLLSNMWSFPIVEAAKEPGQSIRTELIRLGLKPGSPQRIGAERHVFSHIIWEMSVYEFSSMEDCVAESTISYDTKDQMTLASPAELEEIYALPVAFSRVLKHLKNDKEDNPL